MYFVVQYEQRDKIYIVEMLEYGKVKIFIYTKTVKNNN